MAPRTDVVFGLESLDKLLPQAGFWKFGSASIRAVNHFMAEASGRLSEYGRRIPLVVDPAAVNPSHT